ncbi:N-acetylmuramoyl-L-alanine amidase [Synechococcales cyanobacterium C]|uniref:N-acetylmuramoyl-L-alanine amidase n=1 Tax=Petrachloros mirabilis ULC683 TaxID=2781853 RepID=A0A8K2A802_9CYAN|nr:peptidoglycan recognition family protein [Petrachloros mirabilis]NCJ06729.1 N-acetylmuramoyl-L-alanine amidase [Petrachloros mirabilis ULC683]
MNSKRWLPILTLLTLCITLWLGSHQTGIFRFRAATASEALHSAIATTHGSPLEAIPVEGCTQQPHPNPPQPNLETRFVAGRLTLTRFRQDLLPATLTSDPIQRLHQYRPPERVALADPTNFGERYLQDLQGRSLYRDPIVVLHETVGSGRSAINYFQTPHPRDADQASYHTLILLDGTVVYLVPPDKRAFGAGNSVFPGSQGVETVQTNPRLSPSVNNFAYHISLETPPGGNHNGNSHQGYTDAQYLSLGWLTAQTGVPRSRITTHQAVDRSGSRRDPRSFNWPQYWQLLDYYPQVPTVSIGCPAT